MILDILKDMNKYIHGIGVLATVRVEQDKKKGIALQSIGLDKQLIVHGSSELKFSDDDCVFGLGQLGQLQSLLSCPEYEENANITLAKDSSGNLSRIDFANSTGDFTNSYRLMGQQLLDTIMPKMRFLGTKWDLEIEPSLNSIKRFNLQAAANAEETSFTMKLVKSNLEINFGTPATHSGKFVFAEGIKSKTAFDNAFPIAVFQKILNLSSHAEKAELKLTNEGLMCIELNSGLITYQYLIPALSK